MLLFFILIAIQILIEKIVSKKANISNNDWVLNEVTIFETNNDLVLEKKFENIIIKSIYDYEKITSLFKNFDTMSFLDLIINYKELIVKITVTVKIRIPLIFLNQSLHKSLVA